MIKTSIVSAILAATANPVQIMPGDNMLAQREAQPQALAQSGFSLNALYDKFTTVLSDIGSEGKLFADEVEAEFKSYSQVHAEYADYQQEQMPEFAQTEQTNNALQILHNNFYSNIKVQVETPTNNLCAGKEPKFEIVTTKSGKQKKITVKPPKSCGSKSFSSKESKFQINGTAESFLSYVAYDTNCLGNVVDILIDLQDPITSLTPWLFA